MENEKYFHSLFFGNFYVFHFSSKRFFEISKTCSGKFYIFVFFNIKKKEPELHELYRFCMEIRQIQWRNPAVLTLSGTQFGTSLGYKWAVQVWAATHMVSWMYSGIESSRIGYWALRLVSMFVEGRQFCILATQIGSNPILAVWAILQKCRKYMFRILKLMYKIQLVYLYFSV